MPNANEVFRDFERFTGDGKPNAPVGAPLPVGDPRSGMHLPQRKDLRDWGAALEALNGSPAALEGRLVQIEGRATPSYANRAAAEAAAATLPTAIARILVQEGTAMVTRSRTAFADDPLYFTGSRWGVVQRVDMTAEERARQAGDAAAVQRSNHVGIQPMSTVAGLPEALSTESLERRRQVAEIQAAAADPIRRNNLLPAERPGDAPWLYTADVASTPYQARQFPRVEFGVRGPAAVILGAGTIAQRTFLQLSRGHVYRARAVISRTVNSVAPVGDAIELGVALFDRAMNLMYLLPLQAVPNLRVTDGAVDLEILFSDFPENAYKARAYIRAYGASPQTHIESLTLDDVSDRDVWSPDVSDFSGRLSSVESLDIGARLDAAEQALDVSARAWFPTKAAAQAATIGETVTTIVAGNIWYELNPQGRDLVTADGKAWSYSSGTLKSDLTVNIPGDYLSLQTAVDTLSQLAVKLGVHINLNIQSGHQPATGLDVREGNFGHFVVVSDDPVVTLSPLFPVNRAFISGTLALVPTLGCLVDANDRCWAGYVAREGSSGIVKPGCGVMNVGNLGSFGREAPGLFVNINSDVEAQYSVFTGSQRNIWVTKNSGCNFEYGNADGARGDYGTYVSRVSRLSAQGMTCRGCANGGGEIRRSRAILDVSDFSGNGGIGLRLERTSFVSMTMRGGISPKVNDCGSDAIRLQNGSIIHFQGEALQAGRDAVSADAASSVHVGLGSTIHGIRYGLDARNSSTAYIEGSTVDGDFQAIGSVGTGGLVSVSNSIIAGVLVSDFVQLLGIKKNAPYDIEMLPGAAGGSVNIYNPDRSKFGGMEYRADTDELVWRLNSERTLRASRTQFRPESDGFMDLGALNRQFKALYLTGSLRVNDRAVVGARRTGWTPPTGTADREAFSTDTATVQQIAQRLKALIDDLTAHGLIGT